MTEAFSPSMASQLPTVLGRFRRSLNRRVRAPGETSNSRWSPSKAELLRVVSAMPGVSVKGAASELRLAENTVSTLVSRLVESGDLQRTSADNDGRGAALTLTPQSKKRIALWRDERERVLTNTLATLSADEQQAIEAALPVLQRVTAALETDNLPRTSQ